MVFGIIPECRLSERAFSFVGIPSLLDSVCLRPLPVGNADRVAVFSRGGSRCFLIRNIAIREGGVRAADRGIVGTFGMGSPLSSTKCGTRESMAQNAPMKQLSSNAAGGMWPIDLGTLGTT
jgi:hypothetical protein